MDAAQPRRPPPNKVYRSPLARVLNVFKQSVGQGQQAK